MMIRITYLVSEQFTSPYSLNQCVGIQQLLHLRLTLGLFAQPRHEIHSGKGGLYYQPIIACL